MRSDKDWLTTLLLCVFVGVFGVHRFYTGKIGTGLLWAFTGGLFGIGWLVDLIMIACGSFKDGRGLPVKYGSGADSRSYYQSDYGRPDYRNDNYRSDYGRPDYRSDNYQSDYGRPDYRSDNYRSDYGRPDYSGDNYRRPDYNRGGYGQRTYESADHYDQQAYGEQERNQRTYRQQDFDQQAYDQQERGARTYGPQYSKQSGSYRTTPQPNSSAPRSSERELTVDEMYLEYYDAMNAFNATRLHLESNPVTTSFQVNNLDCQMYMDNEQPAPGQVLYMYDKDLGVTYFSYNDGSHIYSYKHRTWYLSDVGRQSYGTPAGAPW